MIGLRCFDLETDGMGYDRMYDVSYHSFMIHLAHPGPPGMHKLV